MEIIDVPGRFARCQLILADDGVTLIDAGVAASAHELELDYIAGRVPRSFPVVKRAFGALGRRLGRPTITRVMSGDRLIDGARDTKRRRRRGPPAPWSEVSSVP